jgi:hypothetical protein
MRAFAVRSIWPGILLLLASAAQAETVEKGYHIEPQVLPQESTDKFLGNVRPYGNGQPSPVIIKPTDQVGAAANSPGRTITEGPSVTSTGKPAAHPRLGGSSIAKGSPDKRPVSAERVSGAKLEKRSITPAPVAPTWQP